MPDSKARPIFTLMPHFIKLYYIITRTTVLPPSSLCLLVTSSEEWKDDTDRERSDKSTEYSSEQVCTQAILHEEGLIRLVPACLQGPPLLQPHQHPSSFSLERAASQGKTAVKGSWPESLVVSAKCFNVQQARLWQTEAKVPQQAGRCQES